MRIACAALMIGLAPGREWASTLPNARLISVPDGGHQLWTDDPSVIAAIDEFLAGKWPAHADKVN